MHGKDDDNDDDDDSRGLLKMCDSGRAREAGNWNIHSLTRGAGGAVAGCHT